MNKSDYICKVPFTDLEVMDSSRHVCCASWLTKWPPSNSTPKDAWQSTEAKEVRDSILDGSYRHCNTLCPYLNELTKTGAPGRLSPIYRKDKVPAHIQNQIDMHMNGTLTSPQAVIFSMDRSCNLQCPSCRLDLIMADSSKIRRVKKDIQEIEDSFGKEVTKLTITGSGDPFISVGFRDFLRNFDKSKWPKLEYIHLHTNATKWNKKMWNSMKGIHPYVKTCEISIDAGTKDTYENHTRINGKWDELMDNLKFINTLPNLNIIKTSFVVQQSNYKEMKMFYDLMVNTFGGKVNVFFNKIINWGTFSDDEFLKHKVWDETHVEFKEFTKAVNRVLPADKAYHNLQEYLNNKQLI